MKRVVLYFCIILGMSGGFAQESKEVLFLIPFNPKGTTHFEVTHTTKSQKISQAFSTSLVGFWEGALLALDDINLDGYAVRAIVRDATHDTNRLKEILNQHKEVDLIIAPVYGNMFPYIADFAQENKIPTVNPFARKRSIAEENPYIYKLHPAETAPAQYIAQHYANHNIILWTHHSQENMDNYKTYFNENNIAYTIADSLPIQNYLSATQRNIIISPKGSPDIYKKYIQEMMNLNHKNLTWIIPEEWLHHKDINFDNWAEIDIAFFSNYFIDKYSEEVEIFYYNFVHRFGHIPTIETFAFQGYDVTNFFVRMICNDFNIPTDITPLSYDFQMQHIPHGGYENQKIRHIKMKQFQLLEVTDEVIPQE